MSKLSYVPFIGKSVSEDESVRKCMRWLGAKKFILESARGFLSITSGEHGLSPSIGIVFRVINPLESCGNTPRDEKHCPILMPGIWMTVSQKDVSLGSPSHVSAIFRKFFDDATSSFCEEEVSLCVGYRSIGMNRPVIMAWKDNIDLIIRKPVHQKS